MVKSILKKGNFWGGPPNHDVERRFPSDINDVRTMIMDGAHSIMKNFPVPQTLLLAAGHGAKLNFAYDARTGTRNYDGLNMEPKLSKIS